MRTVCAWDRHTSYVTGTYRQHRQLVELTGGTPTRGKKGVRASYRHYFRLDYRNLEEQLSDGKIADVSLPEIKIAIEQLSFEERAELAAWLHGWNDDEWDEQMKRDIGSGKLDDVLHEVEEDIKSGRTREMP
jgi:hypothetical protein